MIVPHATAQGLVVVAQAIVKAVFALAIVHEKNDAWGHVSISAGGALMAQAQGEAVNVFREADGRLYQAKTLGRNRAVVTG